MNSRRSVKFNDVITEHTTYSKDEYSRETIDSILQKRSYQRVSDQEWINIYTCLDIYKLYEMNVHKDSFKNNQYHTKP